MQVQRFRKPTVREALADVRSTFGPDALVLSTLMVPARGWRRLTGHREVEVTAAPGNPVSESRPDAPGFVPAGRDTAARRSGQLPRRRPEGEGGPRVDGAEDVRSTLGPDALVLSTLMVPARGWRRLTGHREVEVTAAPGEPVSESRPDAPGFVPAGRDPVTRRSGQLPRRRPKGEGGPRVDGAEDVVARLVAAGLDRALATEVAAALPPRVRRNPSRRQVLDALAARLAPVTAGAEALTGVDVFVGPPGAGKTTTIAKLAAQVRARHGLRPTLVAADGYRVGAVEQLRIYADILGLPFLVARTAVDLERAVSLGDRPMLVDTAGRSPADRGIRDLFDVLSGRPGVRTHLVLAAGTGARDLERVFALYEPAGAARVVLSKVDETGSIAAAVAAVRARRLRMSYFGCGQRVPEDLAAATADALATAMLGDDRPARASWQDGHSEELCG